MKERLENLRKAAIEQLKEAGSLDRVEEIRINFLGKKNELANLMKEMGKLPSDIRPEMGKVANEVRAEIEDFIEKKKAEFKEILLNEKLEKESIDVTIPAEGRFVGKMHPITLGINEIEKTNRKECNFNMKYTRLEIPELILCEPKINEDNRGFVYESFKKESFNDFLGFDVDFCQDNLSYIKYGVIRGLHTNTLNHAQSKLVSVLKGKILDVAVDFRIGRPTYGK